MNLKRTKFVDKNASLQDAQAKREEAQLAAKRERMAVSDLIS